MNSIKRHYIFVLFIFSIVIFSCQKDLSSPFSNDSESALIYASGCKSELDKSLEDVSRNQDMLIYFLEDGVLELMHVNTGFNCCVDKVGADILVEDDKIEMTEYEILDEGGCWCLCLYDLDFKIYNVQSKIYEFILHQNYVSDSAAVHHYYINFADSSQGSCTILRTGYPWGP